MRTQPQFPVAQALFQAEASAPPTVTNAPPNDTIGHIVIAWDALSQAATELLEDPTAGLATVEARALQILKGE